MKSRYRNKRKKERKRTSNELARRNEARTEKKRIPSKWPLGKEIGNKKSKQNANPLYAKTGKIASSFTKKTTGLTTPLVMR